ncbi:MAG: hypothetical protein K5776_10950 [Lachnospiraceae bacterium]|nr:hypothetical protein [Lachnospiraceae bacterium]
MITKEKMQISAGNIAESAFFYKANKSNEIWKKIKKKNWIKIRKKNWIKI